MSLSSLRACIQLHMSQHRCSFANILGSAYCTREVGVHDCRFGTLTQSKVSAPTQRAGALP